MYFVMILGLGHERGVQIAWRFVRLAVLALIVIIPLAAQSAASPRDDEAFCLISPAEAVLQTDIVNSLNLTDRNSPDDISLGCCQSLPCGAILINGLDLVNSYERKTNAHVTTDSHQSSRCGPQGPFRPPRI